MSDTRRASTRWSIIWACIATGAVVGGLVGTVTLAFAEPNLGPDAWKYDLWLAGSGAASGLATALFKWSWRQALGLCLLSGLAPFAVWIVIIFNRIMDSPLDDLHSLAWQIAYSVPAVFSTTLVVERIALPVFVHSGWFAFESPGRRKA